MSVDWLDFLRQHTINWIERNPPATPKDIELLHSMYGVSLPSTYLSFMRQANGGIIAHEEWEIKILSTLEIPVWSSSYNIIQPYMLGAFLFAELPGDEGLVFDTRSQEIVDYPIFAVNYITPNWKEVIFVANNFFELLSKTGKLF